MNILKTLNNNCCYFSNNNFVAVILCKCNTYFAFYLLIDNECYISRFYKLYKDQFTL